MKAQLEIITNGRSIMQDVRNKIELTLFIHERKQILPLDRFQHEDISIERMRSYSFLHALQSTQNEPIKVNV